MPKKQPTTSEVAADCQACGSRCCAYFCFEIDKPTTFQEFENVRWFIMHQGVTVHIDAAGDWYISIANRCLNLDEKGLCRQYETRPMICRAYTTAGCDFTLGDYEYQAVFHTPEQLENYARATMGPKRYDRIKAAKYQQVAANQAKKTRKKKAT